ncbi:hypothetical protein CVT25_003544 [Psilocybe cyanescens]|uniref:CCHC-type domain-containing protein n=1 Tax=Psilocybe cyanescens TaxID=93625 RepID=A0A409W6K0_PSICY|nr:hypothetical protein CVT25_003544 [Psilocybe cyanescens]
MSPTLASCSLSWGCKLPHATPDPAQPPDSNLAVPGPWSDPPLPIPVVSNPSVVLTANLLDHILAANCESIIEANRESMLLFLRDFSGTQLMAPKPSAAAAPSCCLHMNLPPEFDGVSANVSDFLAMIHGHMLRNPADFVLIKTQVLFLLSYCSKGFAKIWHNRMMTDIHNSNYKITMWDTFETLFKDTFLNHYSEDEAARKIALIRQGKLSAQEFLIIFDELVIQSNFNDKAVIYTLKNTLSPPLLCEINQTTSVLMTHKEWRSVETSLFLLPPPQTSSSATPAPSSSNSHTPTPHASLPTSISLPADHLSRPYPDLVSMACHNCGLKGHLTRACLKPYDAQF